MIQSENSVIVKKVSILVMVDSSLRHMSAPRATVIEEVSILVMVDSSLRRIAWNGNATTVACFNPCYGGLVITTWLLAAFSSQYAVSILVMVDSSLRPRWHP